MRSQSYNSASRTQNTRAKRPTDADKSVSESHVGLQTVPGGRRDGNGSEPRGQEAVTLASETLPGTCQQSGRSFQGHMAIAAPPPS